MQQRDVSRVLVIVAHPDDIEFGAGGIVAGWTRAGIQVTYCIVTDGSAGSNDPKVSSGHLVEIRRQEQIDAAAAIGVTDVRFLGYQDGTLEPTIALRRDLTRLIRELKPERVLTTDPTTMLFSADGYHYINHPDHRAAAEAAIYAVFPSAESRPIFPELLAEGLEPHHVNELWMMLTLQPNVNIDVSDVYEDKMTALLCHKSQVSFESTQFIRDLDQRAGALISAQYAEQFRVMTFYDDQPASDGAAAL